MVKFALIIIILFMVNFFVQLQDFIIIRVFSLVVFMVKTGLCQLFITYCLAYINFIMLFLVNFSQDFIISFFSLVELMVMIELWFITCLLASINYLQLIKLIEAVFIIFLLAMFGVMFQALFDQISQYHYQFFCLAFFIIQALIFKKNFVFLNQFIMLIFDYFPLSFSLFIIKVLVQLLNLFSCQISQMDQILIFYFKEHFQLNLVILKLKLIEMHFHSSLNFSFLFKVQALSQENQIDLFQY